MRVVEFPIIMHIDNFGAVFLSDNKLSFQQTKYIDECHNFIRDYVEYSTVNIKFVCSKENMAD